MVIRHAVILAGGLGTRIQPVLGDTPKLLAEIAGKSFLEWKIAELETNGIETITLLVGNGAEKIVEFANDLSLSVKLRFFHDGREPLGTGGAVLRAIQHLPERFFLTYGDTLLDLPYQELSDARERYEADSCMAVTSTIDRSDPNNVLVQDSIVIDHNKSLPELMNAMDYGLMLLSGPSLKSMSSNNRQEGTSLDLSHLIAQHCRLHRVAAYWTDFKFWEIGSPDSFSEVKKEIERRREISSTEHAGYGSGI